MLGRRRIAVTKTRNDGANQTLPSSGLDFEAHAVAPIMVLTSVAGQADAKSEADPVVVAFLGFLSKDISDAPGRVEPLAAMRIKKARELTGRVKVRNDDALPDDVTL